MFYKEELGAALRFGDLLRGFFSTTPIFREPILKEPIGPCSINVDFPPFSVVMDPCCSIGERMISLSPLSRVLTRFFDNPYLADDLTRINRKMTPQQSLPPVAWEKLTNEEKQKRLDVGTEYAFVSLFIYQSHDLLPKYTIQKRAGQKVETNYYMVDFRNTFKLQCDKIVSPAQAPLESKVLELTIEARRELRDKVASYYGRVPAEDEAEED